MLSYFKEAEGQAWAYSGAGYVLVNDLSGELIVLLENEHVDSKGIRLQFTEQGKQRFGLRSSPHYHYWFDIVTAKNDEDVLAYYDWNLSQAGAEELEKRSIPLQFAAVIEHDHASARSYYFAGDFNDIPKASPIYQYSWFSRLKALFSWNAKGEESFYWRTYVPMMKRILAESLTELETLRQVSDLQVATHDGLAYTARVHEQDFEVLVDEGWKKLTIKGVNMGMAKPGTFPGEAGISEEEYYRWFQYIGEMGANTIRIYTLHPPGFYTALKRYNEQSEHPLYLMHGVWIEEEALEETLDAFADGAMQDFQAEMKRVVDAVHGNAFIEHVPGHAHGFYTADISPYVIGWVIGIEWYPYTVLGTNEKYPTLGDYDGQYVYTINAPAFEHWLAMQLDYVMSYEAETYQWMRPVSFTNWVTTDLLTHPAEPNEKEDLVGVDPNVIYMKSAYLEANQFASYHVYPYYPDFLNYEERYTSFIDHRGEYNNYAAYLKDLHAAHRIPILIAEFGVPASRGLTHENPFGWNQGFLSESEQGEIIVRLFEDIIQEGMLGGLIFTWQDEWFKRTWNTMDYDNPNRRPFWSNAQTNEQQFGLLSFDRLKIKVDGDVEDWAENSPLYTGDHLLRGLYMDYDERYLYFRLDLAELDQADPFAQGYPLILLNTVPDQGNHVIDGITDVVIDHGMDYIIKIDSFDESRVLVDSYYDFFTLQYGHQYQMLQPQPELPQRNSGLFNPIYLTLNRELIIPSQNRLLPFSYYETGLLRHGNGDPEARDYDALADFYLNVEQGILEIRIPWLLIGFKDPSQREVIADIYGEGGGEWSAFIDGISVGVLFVQQDQEAGGKLKVLDSLPALDNGRMRDEDMQMFSWNKWELPQYKERLKQSYDIVREFFNDSSSSRYDVND